MAKVGRCVEATEVETVLPVQTWKEKRLRYEWVEPPSPHFLMNWNFYEGPNQMFIEDVDDLGITVTARWALMEKTPEQLAEYLNNWLAKCETGTWKPSGHGGRRLQST